MVKMMLMEKVAKVKDIKEGQGYQVKLSSGEEVAIFRQGEQFFALKDTCPHMGASLSMGEVADGKVFCPWHGWCFHINNGNCETPNGTDTKTFTVIVEGEDIYIQEG